MINLSQFVDPAARILLFLSAFPALWIPGRVILRRFPCQSRLIQLFLWFVLAGVIITPLYDLVKYFDGFFLLILPPFDVSRLYSPSTITLVMGIIVYGLAIFYGRKIIMSSKLPVFDSLQLSPFEIDFVLVGFGGLINREVNGIVQSISSLNIPIPVGGDIGFFISSSAGILILLVTFLIMNELLNRRENTLSEE